MLTLLLKPQKKIPDENEKKTRKRISFWMSFPIAVLVISILFISIAPQYLMDTSIEAAQFLMGMMR